MGYSITKTFQFSAAHQLETLADPHHPCARLHGHNYKVSLTFVARTLDESGFVLDTHRLAFFKRWIDIACDHQNLNDTLTALGRQTTGERLAQYIGALLTGEWFELWQRDGLRLAFVEVSETETVVASYAPPL